MLCFLSSWTSQSISALFLLNHLIGSEKNIPWSPSQLVLVVVSFNASPSKPELLPFLFGRRGLRRETSIFPGNNIYFCIHFPHLKLALEEVTTQLDLCSVFLCKFVDIVHVVGKCNFMTCLKTLE